MADRNPCSPTYGCFDRGYWHYRTLIDYAAPLHQENALTLAIVAQQSPEAPGADDLRTLAAAALAFWCGLQRRDGSFDEFYPYERSFVATAFTAYALSETLFRLGPATDTALRRRAIETLVRAGHWLGRHQDVVVVNHTAGAIAALQNIHRLSGESCFADYRERKVEELLAHQHAEGWFYEYGGADPAYLSLAVDYLAKDYRHSRDERVGAAIGRALDFMVCFLHPDGSFGGEYGSRNAKYLMPHGLELMAGQSAAARLLRRALYGALARGTVVSPALMDDRYTGFFLTKYAEAWADQSGAPDLEPEATIAEPRTRIFPGAGLAVVSGPAVHTVVGLSKHGVIKCYTQGAEARALYSDAGYFANLADGGVATTQWLDLEVARRLVEGPGRLEIELDYPMARMNTALPLVKLLAPFRLFLRAFGWHGGLMVWFGNWVKHRMIQAQQALPLRVKRRLVLDDHQLEVEDHLRRESGPRLLHLIRSPLAGALHVASSRYWQPADQGVAGAWEASAADLEILNRGGGLRVRTCVDFLSGAVETQTGEASR
ncbi:MAG: hypothetical protein IT369_17900 [Candidatus Latescibacteria bacterium]|nr:hypothetical protein [Candidatus Latescibacterota bacterium]